MKQQHRSGFAIGLVFAFMAMVGTVLLWQHGKQMLVDATGGESAAPRLLAKASGFENGNLPSVVKVSGSKDFDGFYENGGSSRGKDGERVEFAITGNGHSVLYYDHGENQWVLFSRSNRHSARSEPQKPAFLPEQGNWRLDSGASVRIHIEGFVGRAGNTFTTDPKTTEKLNEVLGDLPKTPGTSFDVGIDADGKQQNRDVEESDRTKMPGGDRSSHSTTGSDTTNPKTGQTDISGNDTPGAVASNGPGQTGGEQTPGGNLPAAPSTGGDTINSETDQTDISGNDNPGAVASNGPGQTGREETQGGDRSAASTTGRDTKNPNADQTTSDLSAVSNRDESNNPNSNSPDQTDSSSLGHGNNNATNAGQSGNGSHNSDRYSTIDDCAGQNSTNKDCDGQVEKRNKTSKGFPLLFKILLIVLALLSLICACICTASGILRSRKGKEGLEGREPVPVDDPSDMEDGRR